MTTPTSPSGIDLTRVPRRSDRAAAEPDACTPANRITKSLVGYGVLVGPFYVVVSLTQALLREGFDLTRHEWSLLANGSHGWIQSANLAISGLMCVAFALGLRRVLTDGRGARWAPRLVGTYGVSLVVAGICRADPALGFPVGTPESNTPVTGMGIIHFVAAAVGFSCLAVACILMAGRYAAEQRTRWAVFSGLTAGVFLSGFAAVASSGGSVAANLAFTAAVVLVWGWLAAVARDQYTGLSATPRRTG
jgi:hypothetical membrane protein